MKTTIYIPDALLEETMHNAKTAVMRDAVLTAIEDYNRRFRLRALADRLGTSGTFMSHADLMNMRGLESNRHMFAPR